MDELRRAMLDAGTPPDEWQAELPFLIEAGQKRVRRRRMIATGVAAALITAVGTTAVLAGVPGLNKSEPEPVKELPSGIYVEERLPPAEVERRCNVLLNANREKPLEWVAGVDAGMRAVPADQSVEPVETRVGWIAELTPRGEEAAENTTRDDGSGTLPGGSGGVSIRTEPCSIPQEDFLDEEPTGGPLPGADDFDGIAERCSSVAGYDLQGWSVLAAKTASGSLEAVLMSTNGFGVVCTLDGGTTGDVKFNAKPYADADGRPALPADDSGPTDPDRYHGVAPSCRGGDESADVICRGVGIILGLPHAHRIEVKIGGIFVQVATTNHGAFAYGFSTESLGPRQQVRVTAPDGVVVWRETVPVPAVSGAQGGSAESSVIDVD